MTTKVLVVNLGPSPIDVQKISVGPQMTDGLGNTTRVSTVAETTRIPIGSYKEIYVYDSQEIHVSELTHG